jgi:hypothetical protein
VVTSEECRNCSKVRAEEVIGKIRALGSGEARSQPWETISITEPEETRSQEPGAS